MGESVAMVPEVCKIHCQWETLRVNLGLFF